MTMRKLADMSQSEKNVVNYLHALLFLIIFIAVSIILFHKTDYGSVIYVLISLNFTMLLDDIKRNDFLKNCFGTPQYVIIRLIENLIISLPFIVFLLFKSEFYLVLFLLLASCSIAVISVRLKYSLVIPTPFYKKPFEFTIGFRNTFLIFIIAYALVGIAIKWDNPNIGFFSLILIFITIIGFCRTPEDEYFIWIHSHSPIQFIIEKLKTAFVYTLFLCLPVLIFMSVYYIENIGLMLLFTALGYAFLTANILAKYSAYPLDIDIKQSTLLIICLIIPFMLLVIIPVFAKQAINKLNEYL